MNSALACRITVIAKRMCRLQCTNTVCVNAKFVRSIEDGKVEVEGQKSRRSVDRSIGRPPVVKRERRMRVDG